MSDFDSAYFLTNLTKSVVSPRLAEGGQVETDSQRRRDTLYGVLAEYGPAPSAEEIDEARREMWGNV